MSRLLFGTSFVAAILAVAGLANLAVAGENVPFHGSLEGDVTTTPIIGDPNLDVHVEIDGAGTAIHLGIFSVSVPHDVDRRPPPNPSLAWGRYIFTAANGDEVHAEFTGKSVLLVPSVLIIAESATITGGTGRFAGATGRFECDRIFDLAAGTTIGSFKGTISSPGASKH